MVVIRDSLASTENDTAGEKDGTTVSVDVSDASIVTVVVCVLSIDTDDDVDGK